LAFTLVVAGLKLHGWGENGGHNQVVLGDGVFDFRAADAVADTGRTASGQ
jgi:hypothetical protein